MIDNSNFRAQFEGSNCTFMELKSVQGQAALMQGRGSNCTFMELKSRWWCRFTLSRRVLIVPLWN